MKKPACSGAAIAALLLISACSSNEGSESQPPDNAGATGEPKASSPDPEPSQSPAGPQAAAPAPAGGESVAAAPAEPPAAFLQCRSCHAVEPGKNGVGPSLAGVSGRPAASVAGFRYSDALRNAKITWTSDKLDQWLAGPMKMVPGTRMVQVVRDEAQRKAIVSYLETLK